MAKAVKTNAELSKSLEKLIQKGKKNGELTFKDIGDELSEYAMNKNQIEDVYTMLAEADITVLDESLDGNFSDGNKEIRYVLYRN